MRLDEMLNKVELALVVVVGFIETVSNVAPEALRIAGLSLGRLAARRRHRQPRSALALRFGLRRWRLLARLRQLLGQLTLVDVLYTADERLLSLEAAQTLPAVEVMAVHCEELLGVLELRVARLHATAVLLPTIHAERCEREREAAPAV